MPARSSLESPALVRSPQAQFSGPGLALGRRLKALLPQKLTQQGTLSLLFWTGYAWLSRHTLVPAHELPVTWLDRAVAFSPDPWAWIYLSQFLLTGGLPWLIDSRALLRRYVTAVVVLSSASFLVFLSFPVASPRPPLPLETGPLAWIVRADGAYNAFPSLHAGFVVLMMGLGWRIFRQPGISVILAGWALLILYSTLATRQHYAWDLAAGLALGTAADWIAGRIFTRNVPAPFGKPG